MPRTVSILCCCSYVKFFLVIATVIRLIITSIGKVNTIKATIANGLKTDRMAVAFSSFEGNTLKKSGETANSNRIFGLPIQRNIAASKQKSIFLGKRVFIILFDLG